MKRNDIVYDKSENGFHIPYGRINKKLDETHFEVIDCCRFVRKVHKDNIVVVKDYKGFNYNNRLVRMPTLRKLKQMASKYYKVWSRNKTYGKA